MQSILVRFKEQDSQAAVSLGTWDSIQVRHSVDVPATEARQVPPDRGVSNEQSLISEKLALAIAARSSALPQGPSPAVTSWAATACADAAAMRFEQLTAMLPH